MMNKLEEAILYATVLHQGKRRKIVNTPYILHPLEVAQILSKMTDDEDIITAGILHDIVEDTDGTLEEIEKRFGKRVAELVASESEHKYPEEDKSSSWKRRKEESLRILKDSHDTGIQMLWLADKLSNIRSLAGAYAEQGEAVWKHMNQSDSSEQCWYYKSIGEMVELALNRTGAFKEFVSHVNYIWPGTFDSEKSRYRKYKEVSLDGYKQIGKGAKGEVYRYNDELVIKVFNHKNTYKDVEREIALSRKAFILGIPTAISFGIVDAGGRYGAMYELLDSEVLSEHIARNPDRVGVYANMMALLAHTIHGIRVTEKDGFPEAASRLSDYLADGVCPEDEALARKCKALLETIPASDTLVHGDFHTNNVFLQKGEPLLIDLDRISTGHPIVEISDLYYFYVVLGEDDPKVVEDFMGFSYETAKAFFASFLKAYLKTEDERVLADVTEKASFLCLVRKVHRIRKKKTLSDTDREDIAQCLERIRVLVKKTDVLAF